MYLTSCGCLIWSSAWEKEKVVVVVAVDIVVYKLVQSKFFWFPFIFPLHKIFLFFFSSAFVSP